MPLIDNYLSILEPVREQFTRYRYYFRMRWETFAHTLGMLEAAGINPRFGSVVEVGCGGGYYLSLLAQIAGRVTGIDLEDGTARTCYAGFANAGKLLELTGTSNAVVAHGSMESIPLEDSTADLIFSAYVMEHVLDLDAGMAECNRVLRDGGLMVSIVPGAMEKFYYLLSLNYLKHSIFSAVRPLLYLAGIKRDLEAGWHIPFAPWPHDPRKTFLQELREYRLQSWLGLLAAHSHDVITVGRKRHLDHIIISRKK